MEADASLLAEDLKQVGVVVCSRSLSVSCQFLLARQTVAFQKALLEYLSYAVMKRCLVLVSGIGWWAEWQAMKYGLQRSENWFESSRV